MNATAAMLAHEAANTPRVVLPLDQDLVIG